MEKLHYHVDILCSCDSLEDYERIFNFSVKLWTSVVTPSLQYHSSWCIHLNLPYMRMPVHIYLIKWTLVGLKKTFFCNSLKYSYETFKLLLWPHSDFKHIDPRGQWCTGIYTTWEFLHKLPFAYEFDNCTIVILEKIYIQYPYTYTNSSIPKLKNQWPLKNTSFYQSQQKSYVFLT